MDLHCGCASARYGGAVSTYGSAQVRVSGTSSSQVYARRRFGVGIALGAGAQIVIAVILGFILAGTFIMSVRVAATLFSSLIATPALFTVGFALMLKDRSRPLGGGIVLGALLATMLHGLLFLLT